MATISSLAEAVAKAQRLAEQAYSIAVRSGDVGGGVGAAYVAAAIAAAAGLPAGGVLDQSVVNTGPGTGAWGNPAPNGPWAGRRWSRFWLDRPTATTWSWEGIGGVSQTVIGGSGLPANGLIADTPSIYINTININTGVVTYLTNQFTTADYRSRVRMRMQAPASIASRRFAVGFSTAGLEAVTPSLPGPAASALTYVALFYDSSVSPNWLLGSADAVNQGATDTGLAVVAGTRYWLDIDWSVAGTLTARIYAGALTNAPTVTARATLLATGATALYAVFSDISLAAGIANGFYIMSVLWESNG